MTLADFLTVFGFVSDKAPSLHSHCNCIAYLCANATHDCGGGCTFALCREGSGVQKLDMSNSRGELCALLDHVIQLAHTTLDLLLMQGRATTTTF